MNWLAADCPVGTVNVRIIFCEHLRGGRSLYAFGSRRCAVSSEPQLFGP